MNHLRIIDTKKGTAEGVAGVQTPFPQDRFFPEGRGGLYTGYRRHISLAVLAELRKMAEDFAGYAKKKQTIYCLKTAHITFNGYTTLSHIK